MSKLLEYGPLNEYSAELFFSEVATRPPAPYKMY